MVYYRCANSCWSILLKHVEFYILKHTRSQNKLFCKVIKIVFASSATEISNQTNILSSDLL